MQFGYMGDTENVATLVSESNLATEQDISSVGGVMISAYTFRTPTFHASIEALQDVEMAGGLVELFKKFTADRIARGVGPYLVTGQGPTVKQPTGLLNAIEALESNSVVAAWLEQEHGRDGNWGDVSRIGGHRKPVLRVGRSLQRQPEVRLAHVKRHARKTGGHRHGTRFADRSVARTGSVDSREARKDFAEHAFYRSSERANPFW